MKKLMQRVHQLVFGLSLVGLCWLGMMAIHELGHVLGAWVSGGQVERVVLSPLTFSRTDVSPNPSPLMVVWLGPVLGCIIPLVVVWLASGIGKVWKNSLLFFAGFCWLANGAYLAFGAWDGVGDCGVMLKFGTPIWLIVSLGCAGTLVGLWFWHKLGSFRDFWREPSSVDPLPAYFLLGMLVTVICVEIFVVPM